MKKACSFKFSVRYNKPKIHQRYRFNHCTCVYLLSLSAIINSDRRIAVYQENGKGLTYGQTSSELTILKQAEETGWLAEVDKFALQNSLKNLDTAYKNFFRTVKQSGKEAVR